MYDSYGRPISTPTAISEGLRLFNNSEYSDLVLKCKDRSWKVHRVIVCGRCEFFKACVDRNFKGQEAQNGVINLPEDDPDAVEFLVKYLYTYDIETCIKGLPDDLKGKDELAFLMFTTADKYNILELKRYWSGVLEKGAKFPHCFPEYSPYSSRTFESAKVFDFLECAYSCNAPGIENIRQIAVNSLYVGGTHYHSAMIQDKSLLPLFQKYAELRMAFIDILVRNNRQQKPLLMLLKHKSMYSSVEKKPEIGIELIKNLIDLRFV